jgi:hypothetical protein
MNKDDIIRMARETGLLTEYNYREIINFGSMVAAAEREACAKVAESYEPKCDTCPSGVANAIRARGQ